MAGVAGAAGGLMAAAVVAPPPVAAVSSGVATCSAPAGPLASSVGALGFRVAISADGSTAIASAPYANNHSGYVQLYTKSGGVLRKLPKWTDPNKKAGDFYGSGVGVTDTTVVVGAPDTSFRGHANAGWVYFYVRSGNTWRFQTAYAGTGANYLLGASVAISGNTAVVGAPGVSNVLGAAIIFVRSGSTWKPQGEVTPGGKWRGALGFSVAISGSVLVVSDPFHYGHGIVFAFVRSRGTWHFDGPLIDPTPTVGDNFGQALSVSGDTIVVGTGYKCNAAGAAYIYVRKPSGWRRQATLIDPKAIRGDNFGWGVAISGPRVLVGAPVEDLKNGPCGTAFEFTQVGGKWLQGAHLVVADPRCVRDDFFGDSVALAGKDAIIGAPGINKLTGAAYYLVLTR
jgi:hypothetical protein